MRKVMAKFMRCASSSVAGIRRMSSAAFRGLILIVLNYLPVPEDNLARRIYGDVRLMGHQDDCDLGCLVEFLEDVHDLQAGTGVQVTRGLIGQNQDGRFTRARAMATRCCCPPESWLGKMMFPSLKPYIGQRLHGPLPCLSREEVDVK